MNAKFCSYLILPIMILMLIGYVFAATISQDFDDDDYTIDDYKYFQDGRLHFEGNQVDEEQFAIWDGSRFETDIADSIQNTNTFYNFILSVDAYYEGRDDGYGFGLVACMTPYNTGSYNFLRFLINNDGQYYIDLYQNNQPVGLSAGWVPTTVIYTNGQKNTLTITRNNTLYSFLINGREVGDGPYTLTGFDWGHVGLVANMRVDAGFDNFSLITDSDGDGTVDEGPTNVLPSAGSSNDNCFIATLYGSR